MWLQETSRVKWGGVWVAESCPVAYQKQTHGQGYPVELAECMWFRVSPESPLTFWFLSVSVQSLSRVWLFATPWTTAHQASLSITNSQSLLKLKSIDSVMPSNHLILCRPLLLLPSIFPSIRVFSNESVLHIRNFCFSISPSHEYSGLIFFRMDWLDFLAVQGTLKSLLQHHSSKASILQHSAFFLVQLSHPYMTTGETIALTRQTFVGKVMSLLFNMLSGLIITFLSRSKRLLISWLLSPYAAILKPPKTKPDLKEAKKKKKTFPLWLIGKRVDCQVSHKCQALSLCGMWYQRLGAHPQPPSWSPGLRAHGKLGSFLPQGTQGTLMFSLIGPHLFAACKARCVLEK